MCASELLPCIYIIFCIQLQVKTFPAYPVLFFTKQKQVRGFGEWMINKPLRCCKKAYNENFTFPNTISEETKLIKFSNIILFSGILRLFDSLDNNSLHLPRIYNVITKTFKFITKQTPAITAYCETEAIFDYFPLKQVQFI